MRLLLAVALAPRWVLIALTLATSTAHAGTHSSVQFAGIAYTGDALAASTTLKFTDEALRSIGLPEANARILRALHEQPPANFDLRSDGLAALNGSGTSLAVAVAIDRETVTSERIAGEYKLLVELAAQALFFDFSERQVLFAQPVTLRYIDRLPQRPTDEQIQHIVTRLLLGGAEGSLPKVFASELEPLSLPAPSSRRIQLTDVRIGGALASKPLVQEVDTTTIGHEFSKVFSSTLRLPMLPYRSGQAIGGAMAARFADGTVYNLKIPDPDYRITLELSDFRDKVLSQTSSTREQLYGAFFTVRVDEPMSARAYFDQPLRVGATKSIPASQDEVDDWAAYYETMLTGFAELARAIGNDGSDWARQQTGGRDFSKQLKTLKELVATCR